MRPIAVIANGVMLAATPIDGGHYFIDLAAGIAVAALAIVAARMIARRYAEPQPVRAAALPQNPVTVPAE